MKELSVGGAAGLLDGLDAREIDAAGDVALVDALTSMIFACCLIVPSIAREENLHAESHRHARGRKHG